MNDMRLDIENSPEVAMDLADAYAVYASDDEIQRMITLLDRVSPSTYANNGVAIDSFIARLRTHIAHLRQLTNTDDKFTVRVQVRDMFYHECVIGHLDYSL